MQEEVYPPSVTRPMTWVLVTSLLFMASAIMVSAAWLCHFNTLYHNGHWFSSKARLGRYTMGAVSFMVTPTGLQYNRLNLGVWHGFQEVLEKQPMDLRGATFDCNLPKETWVSLIFDKTPTEFQALRISADPDYPNVLVTSTTGGQFTHVAPIPIEARQGWNHVALQDDGSNWVVTVNGQSSKIPRTAAPQQGFCGFRGCLGLSSVANVTFNGNSSNLPGSVTLEDRFNNYSTLPSKLAWAIPVAAGLSIVLFLALSRYQNRGPMLMTIGMWTVVAAGVVFGVQWFYLGPLHPKTIDFTQFPEYRNYVEAAPFGDVIAKEIQDDYGATPFAGQRVLFIGTSQTWGSGADTDADTWVRDVERKLPNVQCINGGVSGALSRHMLAFYETQWLALKPQVTVIDLAFNDPNTEELVTNVSRMLDLSEQHGIKSLLILEPNCPEYHDKHMPEKRLALQALADRRHVPYIDMQSYLTSHQRDGYLWWDMVHLTSFGQQLFADRVYPSLLPLLAPAAASSSLPR